MSQHSDLTSVIVAKAIKSNWSLEETKEHYFDILSAAEYDEDFMDVEYIINKVDDMLYVQRDGLYGISHKQIAGWKLTNNI